MLKVEVIKQKLMNGEYKSIFKDLYVDESTFDSQARRYICAVEKFEELFHGEEAEVYSAPGRTEIGGNHTDHQNGKVLAASVNLDTIAVVGKRNDKIVNVKSEGYPEFSMDLTDLSIRPEEEGSTKALIRGVANTLEESGYVVGGFDAYVTSDVLSGSGLSSSAAFEVLIGNIFSGLYNENKLDAIYIAKAGQKAEREYFGKPCGLMDQMASSVGGMVFIDFADESQPDVQKLAVDFQSFGYSLCIVDTKGSHADLTDDYAAIPQEMRRVAEYFGKKLLCQVEEEVFYQNIAEIRKSAGDRAVLRAMHWFEENKRVDLQKQALENQDFKEFQKLINESGNSSFKYLQNVFSTKKSEEQGVSLALALSELFLNGQGVSRVHGGGFAGTIQAFVPKHLVEEYKKHMEAVLGEKTCHVLQIRAAGGVKVI